ncbi:MAG: rhodanese-like domain-containing protein [Alphaproteobacteria bacterium]|nr:rhodanese-like domain-containing protein [Alphaproteobacteria bacterium]
MTSAPLKRGFKKMLAEANAVIETVSVPDLPYLQDDPDVVILDVRDAGEREAEGAIPDSIHTPRGLLEFLADPESPIYNDAISAERRLVLYCGTGGRSALAAKTLVDMGYPDVLSLAGGYSAWAAADDAKA